MANLLSSLQGDVTTYTVFETDQLLTADQLNEATLFLDDQERLTRVELVGVGIACGLRLSLADSKVKLTKGTGNTSHGYVIYLQQDTLYGAFRVYGANAPPYAKLDAASPPIQAWELLPEGTQEPDAQELASFGSTGQAIGDMVGLLLIEVYEKDRDSCSGTDCDNLGKRAIHKPRLLLVSQAAATQLQHQYATADAAAKKLRPLAVRRPQLRGVSSVGELQRAYAAASTTTLEAVEAALATFYRNCKQFIADIYPADPTGQWLSKLRRRVEQLSDTRNAQYAYDLVRDFAETYESFRAWLSGDDSVCCPGRAAFPKHLLLGNLADGAAGHRTGYYPSRAVERPERLNHARFLARKLGALVDSFEAPRDGEIRVTPSLAMDRSLEERAIPFYYGVRGNPPIHEAWSHGLTHSGMAAHNYAYHGDLFSAQGAAAKPLAFDLGRFTFFRIEGHIGGRVKDALARLKRLAADHNLPFAVHAVLLEKDKAKIVDWAKPPYTFLHRLHRALRYELADHVEAVGHYAGDLEARVKSQEAHTVSKKVKADAALQRAEVQRAAGSAASRLRSDYHDVEAGRGWGEAVEKVQLEAGAFKSLLGAVAKTEFPSPFDSIIAKTSAGLLAHLQDIIEQEQVRETDRHLFSTFIDRHPGLEHYAGVVKGGTFVLGYDSTGIVVADFMLPYWSSGPDDVVIEKPPKDPKFRVPAGLIERAITLKPPLEILVADEVRSEWDRREPRIEDKFAAQRDILKLYLGAGERKAGAPDAKVRDEYLRLLIDEVQTHLGKLEHLNKAALESGREAAAIRARSTGVETELGNALVALTDYVETSKADLAQDADGSSAMVIVASALQRIKAPEATKLVTTGLRKIAERPGAQDRLKRVVGVIVGQ
jgi:hypothetical protein